MRVIIVLDAAVVGPMRKVGVALESVNRKIANKLQQMTLDKVTQVPPAAKEVRLSLSKA